MNKKIKLTDANKKEMEDKIKEYFEMERGESLGILGSKLILDFFLEELAPIIYNQAVEDSYTYMKDITDDLLALKKGRF